VGIEKCEISVVDLSKHQVSNQPHFQQKYAKTPVMHCNELTTLICPIRMEQSFPFKKCCDL